MIKPFTNPKYQALKQRSGFLATLFGLGHVFFVLFLALALILPVGIIGMLMIDSGLTKERAWDVMTSSVAASLLIATIGFGVRQYIAKKGGV